MNLKIMAGLGLCFYSFAAAPAFANIPGGGNGTGANVTLTDNGSTVTMANGIVSIVITKTDASIHTINYTYNNSGSSQTANLLAGGSSGGELYWFQNAGSFIAGPFTESVVANNGNYAEVSLIYASPTNGVMDIHYSMLRGSPGFYTTPILTHCSQDGVIGIELRPNIYAGSTFNWLSVDAARNKVMNVTGTAFAVAVQGAPQECFLWTNGIYAGQYEDKYKYTADLATLNCWGWSSVGAGGKNVGIWNVSASGEYYPGGPLERSLMEHIGTTILNVFTGHYYGMATDGTLNGGELWSKTYGPYFYYCNNVTNTITSTNLAAQALYNDALAQGAAEQTAWPYSWLTNASYTSASGRGTITGKLVISDSGNPNASAAGMWVGVAQQPAVDVSHDFQQWTKPYQFWVKTDTNGNFTIPNVIGGTNYTLFAFGTGAAGTFQSQNLTGGNPPLLYKLPASPFSVTVTGGATNNLGTVTWTPARIGATVFEIGYPDRTAAKFRHGDDYWLGDIGPSATVPSPVWSKWLEYPFDFPNGVNYTVGQSRWSTDWNFIQPVVTDSQGNYNSSSSTITFNLASAPTNGAMASFYLGLCSDYDAAVIVTVNGVNVASISGLSGSPNAVPSTGYFAAYSSSDSNIREGNNGAFTDERLTFTATALHAGQNTINLSFRQTGVTTPPGYFADHFMYDYVRLELTGYVPPVPAGVSAYAGNNSALVSWPVTPGATSYKVLRATAVNGTYSPVTNGVVGPVCGSGWNNAIWLDTTAANGSTYYYEVQSVNPTGTSVSSAASAGASPAGSITTSAPAAPTGLTVGGSGHQSVTLNWSASAGASYYSVWRSVLANTGGGSSNTLNTIILNNATTNTTYTDASPTDGSLYSYYVTASSPGGTSGSSAPVVAKPLPAAPSSVPVSLTGNFVYGTTTNIVLNWTAVPGAVGYVISRATSLAGSYTYLQTVTETTYTDSGLNAAVIYFYRVAAMNGAGTSANATDLVNSQQAYPASLNASGTNAAILLTWPATTGATSYNVKRGTSFGNETTTVVSGYGGTTYTNTGLVNGTTYYYVVTATGAGGTSGNSPEASATPFANSSGIWTAPAGGNWGDAGNWSGGGIASGPGSFADFSTLSLSSNVTVTLDSPRTIGSLQFGDTTATYDWTVAGTNTLTFGVTPTVNVVNETASLNAPLAGTAGLTKTGPGALIFGGATNSLTGGLTVNAGSLTLDFTVTHSPATNLMAPANGLTLGGGALQVSGSNNVSSQTFAATALNAGQSAIAGSNLPTVNLGTITANAGGVVLFNGPATVGPGNVAVVSNAIITLPTLGNGAFVGGNGAAFSGANYATVGLYDYAATIGSAPPYTVVGGSQIAGFYTSASGSTGVASGNLDVVGNISSWTAQPYLASIRCNASLGVAQTISASGSGSTLTLADILVTPNVGAYNVTFNNGSFRPGSSGYSTPFVVWQNNPAGELVLNTTIGNSKSSTSFYVQAGPGTVWINNTSSGYTGQSYLNGGVTLIGGNGSIGATATGAAANLNGGTLLANGTFTLDNGGANLRPVNLLNNGGGLAATAGNTLTVDGVVGSAAGTGPLTIGLPASSANNNTQGLLPGSGAGTANPTAVYANGTVVLTNANYYTGGTVLQSGTLNFNGLNALGGANYGGVTFNGGTLQYAAGFTGSNGSSDLTSVGAAGITLAAGGGTIDLNGNVVTYVGSIGNNGPGALTVQSTLAGGSLNLQGANAYAGNTTVSNATLLVNNTSGSATGSGDITVQNGATLAGNGAVDGSVTVQNGGTLVPGDLTDSLNLGGDLMLATGSTNVLQVQHSPLANSSVIVGGTLTEGGTLIVTNPGGALANGDTFTLFSAANYAGSFDQIILPALTGSLVWNTNTLATAGTLSVVTLTSPVIAGIQFDGTNLVLTGSGGVAGWPYYVLASTNLTTAQWTPVATNQFDAAGNFNVTNAINPALPQTFFRLQLQ
jgi:rhamnogalacturonan endolyase